MLYPILAIIYFTSIALGLILLALLIFRKTNRKVWIFYSIWFGLWALFIIFGTGPNLSTYPPQQNSPYKLPWAAGVTRFTIQGNRSFTSHRGNHTHAWDFGMWNGTEVLAAREGKVIEVLDQWDGVGFNSNAVGIEHSDGTIGWYAHIQKNSAMVHEGDYVKQGQPIALSGMVGQTIFPHLHFVVQTHDRSSSVPISFAEVPGGVPLAGHFYTSENSKTFESK